MREIDLKKYKIRTDLIADVISDKKFDYVEEIVKYVNDIKVSNIVLKKDNREIGRKKGLYTTIFF